MESGALETEARASGLTLLSVGEQHEVEPHIGAFANETARDDASRPEPTGPLRSIGGRGEVARLVMGEHGVRVHDADATEAVKFRTEGEHEIAAQPGECGVGPARREGEHRDQRCGGS